jgi:hypothetical protein
MIKYFLLIVIICCGQKIIAQELFVFTEPASNMPAKSIGIRAMNSFMNEEDGSGINYHLMPEVMIGINKKLMMHAQGFISNRSNRLLLEGGALYAKYRFVSIDDVHSHFRMAAFGRVSTNNSSIHQEEIETMGHNNGFETGIIATQLLHKVAISSSLSYEKVIDDSKVYYTNPQPLSAVNYTLSIGKLMLPKVYTSYNQTNLNLMVELLGQRINANAKSFLDIAPSLQLIIKSQARIDFGYRYQLYSNMVRTAPNGFVVKLEYTFFNAFK